MVTEGCEVWLFFHVHFVLLTEVLPPASALDRLPLAFVNQPVVEACTLCLLQVVMETESVSVYTLPVPV